MCCLITKQNQVPADGTFVIFLVIFSTLPPLISRCHFPVWDFKLHRLVNWQYLGEISALKSETLCLQLLPDYKGMDNTDFFLIYPTWTCFLLSAFKVNFCPRRDCRHWQNKDKYWEFTCYKDSTLCAVTACHRKGEANTGLSADAENLTFKSSDRTIIRHH